MIARVQEGFLALKQGAEGNWIPVTGDIQPSAENAVDACVDGVRAQLDQLNELVEEQTRLIDENLARLRDFPAAGDEVSIWGAVCELGEDGTVKLSEENLTALKGKLGYRERYQMLCAEVDDAVYNTLRTALKLPRKREKAMEIMIDHALLEPQALLDRVAARAPTALGEVADFIVRVYRADKRINASQGTEEKKKP